MSTKLFKSSIIYVNFAPYENAGHILDYILDNYKIVILYCFNFHKLTKNDQPSQLTVFKDKKIVYTQKIYYLPTPSWLVFLLLPLRSFVILLQLIYHTYVLYQIYGPFKDYFTVNGFTAWCGILLKKLGLVERTIFWIWDYYPPTHPNLIVRFMRNLYWFFDKPATIYSDNIIFLNKRLITLRKEIGVLKHNKSYSVVGIGTKPMRTIKFKNRNSLSIVFLGVVKKSQGLDLIFDSSQQLQKKYTHIALSIIGSGPDENYYKKRATITKLKTTFYGYITNENKIDSIIRNADIGLATYIPEKSNVSYYSDPSKIKRYISMGIPVITTNVFNFSSQVKSKKAGIVIPYNTHALINAIEMISKSKNKYAKNALNLAQEYRYDKLYKKIFLDSN